MSGVVFVSRCSGLKGGGGGASDGQGSTFTYTFHGDPHATFATFFGGSNPFEMFFGRKVNTFGKGLHQLNCVSVCLLQCLTIHMG